MLDEVTFRLFNFNPEKQRADGEIVGNEAFGEFIFANTRYAKMVAKKKLFDESEINKNTESIDNEKSRQRADVLTSSSVDSTIEPKIDPLTFLPEG